MVLINKATALSVQWLRNVGVEHIVWGSVSAYIEPNDLDLLVYADTFNALAQRYPDNITLIETGDFQAIQFLFQPLKMPCPLMSP